MTNAVADTNVFLRYLTADLPNQAEKIEARFRQAKSGKIMISVLHIAVVEILFHLENWYHLSKKESSDKLVLLFSQPWLDVDEKRAVLFALTCYPVFNIDFVDLLTWSIAKIKNVKILSFDKHYDRLAPKLRLNP